LLLAANKHSIERTSYPPKRHREIRNVDQREQESRNPKCIDVSEHRKQS
jgi:hypothetical protein